MDTGIERINTSTSEVRTSGKRRIKKKKRFDEIAMAQHKTKVPAVKKSRLKPPDSHIDWYLHAKCGDRTNINRRDMEVVKCDEDTIYCSKVIYNAHGNGDYLDTELKAIKRPKSPLPCNAVIGSTYWVVDFTSSRRWFHRGVVVEVINDRKFKIQYEQHRKSSFCKTKITVNHKGCFEDNFLQPITYVPIKVTLPFRSREAKIPDIVCESKIKNNDLEVETISSDTAATVKIDTATNDDNNGMNNGGDVVNIGGFIVYSSTNSINTITTNNTNASKTNNINGNAISKHKDNGLIPPKIGAVFNEIEFNRVIKIVSVKQSGINKDGDKLFKINFLIAIKRGRPSYNLHRELWTLKHWYKTFRKMPNESASMYKFRDKNIVKKRKVHVLLRGINWKDEVKKETNNGTNPTPVRIEKHRKTTIVLKSKKKKYGSNSKSKKRQKKRQRNREHNKVKKNKRARCTMYSPPGASWKSECHFCYKNGKDANHCRMVMRHLSPDSPVTAKNTPYRLNTTTTAFGNSNANGTAINRYPYFARRNDDLQRNEQLFHEHNFQFSKTHAVCVICSHVVQLNNTLYL
eukprot:g8293.t1